MEKFEVMKSEELSTVDGGSFLFAIAAGYLIKAAFTAADDPDGVARGFLDAFK